MPKTFLYLRFVCAAIGIVICGAALPSAGQDKPQLKRPHEEEPEQKPVEVKKKVKGPRAIGVLQLSGNKATLIPVAIEVDGKFYDASIYKADPVPMALESGTVYEGEKAGESQGLYTSAGAFHSKTAASGPLWLGSGKYFANGTEAAQTTRKAEKVPVGIDGSGDEPPRLTRKAGAAGSSKSEAAEKNNGPGADGGAGGPAKSGDPKNENPPEKDPPGEKKGAQAKPDSDQSANGKPAGAARGGTTQGKEEKSQEEDSYYRPTLRRGKPTQAAPEEEDSAPKVGANAAAAGSSGAGGGPQTEIMAAVSDGGGPQPQSYKFFWKEGEEEERRKQMLALATEELRSYISARAKGAIGSKTTKSKAAGSSRKPAEPMFSSVQFQAFDLWKTNQPVMILQAEARFGTDEESAGSAEPYSITLVSRTDIYGSLRRLYSGITDKFHLDVTPRLQLIDAVDADGDGRGELLFQESNDGGKGYVIYRATGDKLWKMFDSFGGE